MSPWKEIGQSKRDAIATLLPSHWRLEVVPSPAEAPNATSVLKSALNERELEITEKYTLAQLLESLTSGKLTSEEVTSAFCHRATIAHQLV